MIDTERARDGILAENKFRISVDLFRIHLGRASISAKFRIICLNFGYFGQSLLVISYQLYSYDVDPL